jgi:branched-chain amino acid transport system ATP-binding protein
VPEPAIAAAHAAPGAGPAPASVLLDAGIASARYGNGYAALHDFHLRVAEHEVVAIVGANGAGKSTLMRSLMGMIQYAGRITLRDAPLDGLGTAARTRAGLVLIPEDKGLFSSLSVSKHLHLSSSIGRGGSWTVDRVRDLFPRLDARMHAAAGTLSGGEQQMLAISRALLLNPVVLLLDEPSLGLAPAVCDKLFEALKEVCRSGLAIVLNEQNPAHVLSLADRVLVVQQGRLVFERQAAEIADLADLARLYLE